MSKYLVLCLPKRQWNTVYNASFMVVDADSKAAAVRKAQEIAPLQFEKCKYYLPAAAELLLENHTYRA